MPSYRIYRMKDAPRQQFRWAPHVSGCASVKRKDYEEGGRVEAAHEYDAWRRLREEQHPLGPGDLLENEQGELRICKYVGFDAAQWVVPETRPRPETGTEPVAAGGEQPQGTTGD